MFNRMDEEEYLKCRVDDQINWYNRKSQNAQKWFKLLRGFEIFAAASIPLVAGFGSEMIPVNLIVAVLGVLIAISSAMISLNQYQENWIEYRTTCESLQHEKFLFLTRSDSYQEENPYPIFVQRVESLISKENSNWSQYAQRSAEKSKEQKQA